MDLSLKLALTNTIESSVINVISVSLLTEIVLNQDSIYSNNLLTSCLCDKTGSPTLAFQNLIMIAEIKSVYDTHNLELCLRDNLYKISQAFNQALKKYYNHVPNVKVLNICILFKTKNIDVNKY